MPAATAASRLCSALRKPKGTEVFTSRTTVVIVSDYSSDDLAAGEVKLAVSNQVSPNTRVLYVPVLGMSTEHTGFVARQMVMSPPKGRRVIYINCAPRADETEARPQNAGEKLVYGVLFDGTFVVAVNSGYSLSLLRPQFNGLWECNIPHSGSQFRSRDFFPKMVGWAAAGWFKRIAMQVRNGGSLLGARLVPEEVIPRVPSDMVMLVDNFGNIKTGYTQGDTYTWCLKAGQHIRLTCNDISVEAVVAFGSFEVPSGTLAFSLGSSGPEHARHWELFLRGGSAASLFHHPHPGARVTVEEL